MGNFALASLTSSTIPLAFAQATDQPIRLVAGFCFIIIIFLILAAWVSLISALLYEWVQRKIRVIYSKSMRVFLLGLLLWVILSIAGLFCGALSKQFPPASAIGLLLAFVLWSAFSLGLVPVSWVIGGKIARVVGIERDDLISAIFGIFCLFLSCLVPIVGWTIAVYWIAVSIGLWVIRE